MFSMWRRAVSAAVIAPLVVVLTALPPSAQALPGGQSNADGNLKQPEGTLIKAEIVLKETDLQPHDSAGTGGRFQRAFRLSELLKLAGAVCDQKVAGTSSSARELLWFKGIGLEAGSGSAQAGQFSLMVDPALRNSIFPEGERCQEPMLMTLTPDYAQLYFPEGLAVPAASDEIWTIVFKPASAATAPPPRLNLYFVRDSELVYPIQAVRWKTPLSQPLADAAMLSDGQFARPQWRYENASTNAPFCGIPSRQAGESPAAR